MAYVEICAAMAKLSLLDYWAALSAGVTCVSPRSAGSFSKLLASLKGEMKLNEIQGRVQNRGIVSSLICHGWRVALC